MTTFATDFSSGRWKGLSSTLVSPDWDVLADEDNSDVKKISVDDPFRHSLSGKLTFAYG